MAFCRLDSAFVMVTPIKPDATLTKAVDEARAALVEQADATAVGEHLGFVVEGDRVVTHLFACELNGYVGWRWSVTIARASRHKAITVDEVVLIPGVDAILAPEWVPYKERIKPGDLSPGDLLPVEDDDPRLVPTYSFGDATGDTAADGEPTTPETRLSQADQAQIRQVATELYLGRVRTLSVEGRDLAAERWYAGHGGPESPLAQAAPAQCVSCGFLVRLAGPLSELFGVCANGNANDDGKVVSLDHGCGAHSEVQLSKRLLPEPLPEPVFDTLTSDEIELF
jgi:hypothetical protein